MKIGILTMHRVKNYGSFLQAYALKKTVENYNNECTFYDFLNGEPKHIDSKKRRVRFVTRLKRRLWVLSKPSWIKERRRYREKCDQLFETDFWPRIGVSTEQKYNYNCDLMIIGSDEVFNYAQNDSFGYVPFLFGHGLNAKKVITYAASAGYATIEDIEQDSMSDEIEKGFKKIDEFSVRDENTFSIVEKYSEKTPELVLDPTLIYSFEKELPKRLCEEEYIFIYAYECRMNNPVEIKKIRQFANQKKLKLVSAGFCQPWCDKSFSVNPFELLSLFKHASYVITDTFHGSIFSIKFNKQFVSFIREKDSYISNCNKLGFLIKQFGLEKRVVSNLDQLFSQIDKPIDYDNINMMLEDRKNKSIKYLEKWIENK